MAKIAFVEVTTTVSYGGVQTAIWCLARELRTLGHSITVYGGVGTIKPDIEGTGVNVKTFPFTPREQVPNLGTRFRRIIERLTFAWHAKHDLLTSDYDWIIITKPFDFFLPYFLRKNNRTRYAFISQGSDFFAFDRKLAKNIHAWFSCSEFNAWQVRSRYKKYPKVIYNGVDVNQFKPIDTDNELKRKLGVAHDEVLFGFAGRIEGWKGLSVAIKAMAEPVMRNVPARLLIVGNGADKPRLQALCLRLELNHTVIFHDAVTHTALPKIYAGIDVGVFPSIGDEAFGITIAEAMSTGKPVIASYIGGIPEVVGNQNSCGLLIGAGNVSGFAMAMAEMAKSATQRQKMGESARNRVINQFTWKASAQRLLAELEAIQLATRTVTGRESNPSY